MDGLAHHELARDLTRPQFDYDEAFSRNLGWVTPAEQQVLRGKRVAIAGLGGVGGSHLLTLTRLGIGAFSIADFDRFELANFNRQAGAMMSTVGQSKAETLARMARDINPTVEIRVFPSGIDPSKLDAFLEGVDAYVDSLDFFVLDLRIALFRELEKRGIPAVIAAPIGMGTGYLVFRPGGMSFDEWFGLSGEPPERQRVKFMLGLTPRGFQRRYLMDVSRVDLKGERGPSTGLSCELCAGVASAEVLKLLLGRGKVRAVPHYQQFDAYAGKLARGWLPGGHRNPWQRLKIELAMGISKRWTRNVVARSAPATDDLSYIIERARWAPSGDNGQPWRFERLGESRLRVHLQRSPANVYDFADGYPTLLAGGFLLETMRLAASQRGRRLSWSHEGRSGDSDIIAVALERDEDMVADPLAAWVEARSVDRGRYRRDPLSGAQKAALAAALGDGFVLEWHESREARRRMARLNALATDIRLKLRKAYEIHREIVDWERDFSPSGLPAKAIALDPLTLRLMRWAMGEWRRIEWLNATGLGTLLARLEMDLLPGIACAAHFTVRSLAPLASPQEILRAGERLQRFWLTATSLGLVMQPSLAPLCFAHYARASEDFGAAPAQRADAARLAEMLAGLGSGPLAFMGRIGTPRSRRLAARSVRRLPEELEAATPALAGAA